jgi:hypothetical protein
LSERLSSLRDERQIAGEWCPGLETTSPLQVFGGFNEEGEPIRPSFTAHTTFEDLEGMMSPSFKPLSRSLFVERAMVVDFLMADPHINRSIPDQGMKERLLAEYIPGEDERKAAKLAKKHIEERTKGAKGNAPKKIGSGSAAAVSSAGTGLGSNGLFNNVLASGSGKRTPSSIKSGSNKSELPVTVRIEEFKDALCKLSSKCQIQGF